MQTDNGTEFKNSIMNQFWLERNVKHIFRDSLNPQSMVLLKRLTGQFKIFFTLAKNHQKDYNSLGNFISNFLLYYNGRLHSITKIAPFKAIILMIRNLLLLKRRNTLKRILKVKTVSETVMMAVISESQIILKLLTNSMSVLILREDQKKSLIHVK